MIEETDVVAAERDLVRRIRTEGVQAAYEAALAVAKDAKAPAPARATAAATLFRVAGYFDRRDDGKPKEPHEMSAEELDREIAAMRARQRRGEAADAGVFD